MCFPFGDIEEVHGVFHVFGSASWIEGNCLGQKNCAKWVGERCAEMIWLIGAVNLGLLLPTLLIYF
jgi:hypothetical protein